MARVDPQQIRQTHRELTRAPHPAGSERNQQLAALVGEAFVKAGMQGVLTQTHSVLLPKPREVTIRMTQPREWRATLREEPIAADPDTAAVPADAALAYHAYSASGEVDAPVVFAGGGMPSDFEWLKAHGIDVRGAIVLVRSSSPHVYRGFKAFTAQQHGAAGILMYSDPADTGRARGEIYPNGPWAPDTRIERGGIVYDFIAPGDPLTPGWPSHDGAKRLSRAEVATLPRILSAPISARDAKTILDALGGPAVPASWRGGLGIEYRAGPGPARLTLTVRMDDAIRPVITVTGMFRGAEFPDEVVIVGNHRDAWVFGGVDPSGGTAVLLELGRTLGSMWREGWRPKRSILFASWDGEEYALTSSTEWGEEQGDWLRERAVAYLNVDSGASGRDFVVGSTPSLMRLLSEAAHAVRDPASGASVGAIARDRRAAERGVVATESADEIVQDRLGGGSDYTVFLNRLGIPSADLAFDGPFGVYHSIYDTHQWVARFGDPGFRYHAALTQIWGLAALRLAQADALPLDPQASARSVMRFIDDVERRLPIIARDGARGGSMLKDARSAAEEFGKSAQLFARLRDSALAHEGNGLGDMNRRVLTLERAFIDAEGLPGRTWYRHLIHAPRPTYEPEVLPGLDAAIEARDERLLRAQEARLVTALRRASARLAGR